MTPQKVFMEHMHFWLLPLILVVFKILFDVLPKPVFFGAIALIVVGYYSYGRFKVNQSERTAKSLEESADSFLNELNSAEKAKREKDAKKKKLKEQQKEDRLRTQQMKKKAKDSANKSESTASAAAAPVVAENDDEDDEDVLIRMANQRVDSGLVCHDLEDKLATNHAFPLLSARVQQLQQQSTDG